MFESDADRRAWRKASRRKPRYHVLMLKFPAGWRPELGERVYIPHGWRATGIVETFLPDDKNVPESIVRVRIIYARWDFSKEYLLRDVRPYCKDLTTEGGGSRYLNQKGNRDERFY